MATKNIGYIVDLMGTAEVRTAEGIIKVLSIGDTVSDRDVLITGPGSNVVIEFYSGQKLQVSEDAEILLDETVYTNEVLATDSQVDQISALQQAILEGKDLSKLEPTAAGSAQRETEGLHQTSIFERDPQEGNVDTRPTDYVNDQYDYAQQVILGQNDVLGPAGTVSVVPTTTTSISINSITADSILNAAESLLNINVTGTVSGDATVGDTVNFTINGTNYSGLVTAGSVFSISVSGADLVAQTSFVASVSGTDTSGNPFTVSTTSTHTVDTTAPTIAIAVVAVNDVIDDAEDNSVTVNGTTTGVEDGQTVTVNINGTNYTTTVTANAWSIPNLDLSGLADGANFTVTADVSDVAGNAAVQATRPISTIDTTAPTISIGVVTGNDVIDDAEDNSVTVSGTSTGVEDGQTVTVNINGTNYTTTVTANAWSIPNLDLSGLADEANFTVTADVSDVAGNVAVQATRPISTIDTTAPTISIGMVAGNDVIDDSEDNNVSVSGTSTGVEDGQTVTVNINGTNYTTTVTANAWSIPNLDLSGLADGANFTVTADVSDVAGNAAVQATRPISTIDTTAPTISIGVVAGNDVIDDTEDNSVTVSGTSTGVEDGQTVTVNINGTNYTTTVTANAWSIPNLDLSGLADNTNFTVTADVSDVAGNAAVQATRPISTIDTTAPTILINTIATDDVVDDAEDNSVTVSGTSTGVEDGQTVTVNINGTNYTTTVTANAWSIPNLDLSGLADGANFTVTADVSDVAGNAATQATRPISTIDTTAPTIAIAAVAVDDVIDDAEDNSVTVNGTSTGVEDGQTVTVNINGTNYTTTVTANAWSIPNLDLSGLADNTNFTVTADVSDVAGNAAVQATRPISTIDTTAPTISINTIATDDVVDDTEDNSVTVSGTSTGVEDGQTVTVNINGTNYTTTVTANIWSIPNLDLSGLADGANFTVTADVSDAAGNAAVQATRPISTIDTTAPTIAISVIAGNDVIDDAEDNSVTVSGTSTGVEDGQTVTVNINGTNYTTTVTANAWSVPNLDLSGLADNTNFTVTADVSDAAGNAATQATRPISTIDTTAPTISIGTVAGNDVIDDAEDNSVTVSGTSTGVEDGQTVTVNINGTNYTTTVTANAWSIPNLDLSGLADGANFTVTADVSDVAGNGAVQATRPISTIDTTAPTIAISVVAGNDVIDDSEDNSVTINGTTANVEDGQTVTVNINGTNYTTTVTANAWSIPNLDLSGLTDGANFTVTADVSDVAGNAAVQATRPISTIDTTAPTISINTIATDDVVDDAEDNSVTVSGTSTGVEDGQTVTVNINGTNFTTTVTANAWSIPNLDLSGLADNTNFTVTADVSDAAGNVAVQATRPISTIDTTAPTIAIAAVAVDDVIDDAEDNSVTVSGISTGVEDGQTVTVNINGTNYTTTVTANAWSIPNLDLSGLADNTNFTVTADVSDVAGNAAVQATRPISTIDTTAPTILINTIATDDVVDDAEDNSVTVSGTSTGVEDGQTVTVNINGTNYTTTVTANAWSIPNLDLSGLTDGANFTVTADVSDAAGNTAVQATRPISTIDTSAPTISIGMVAGNDVIDDAEDNSVTISGTSTGVEDGQTVTVNINGTNYTTTVTANAWSIPNLDLSGLADGANFTVTADVSDAAGNAAVQATRPVSTIDTTAPTIAISVIAGNDVIDDAEDNGVTVSGTSTGVEDGQTVTVNINGTNYTTTVTANAWSIPNLDLSGLADGANFTVTADVSDVAGNAAVQATRPISTIDTTAPTISIGMVAGNDVIDDAEDNSVTISGTSTGVEDGQTVTVNINGTNYTTTVTANAWSIPNLDLSGLADGANFTVTADVSDVAGNAAVQATRPISTIDTTAPTIAISVVASNDVIDDAEDNSVTVGGTSTGVEDGQTVTVNINGTNYTTTVTANAWSIPNLDLSGLADGANFTVTADVSDVAGNAAVQATRPISTIDTTAPTILINTIATDDVVDDTEDNSVTVSGTSTGVEDGQTVTVNINGTNYTTTVTANAWSIPNLDLSGLADGANFTVTADVSDAAGNAAVQATRPISTIDTTAPTIAISVIAGNDVIDDAEDNSVTVSGTSTGVEDGQTVTVNINGTNYTTTVSSNAWSVPNLDLSGLADNTNFTVTADVSDAAGNAATQATRPISTIDTTAPTIAISVIAVNDVIDDSEDNSVTINGTTANVEDGQTVTININGTNYTTTVTANAWSIPNLDLSGLADGANFTVTADVSDAAGNAAVQATRPISTIDTTAPTIAISVIAGNDVIDDAEDNSVTVSGTSTGVEDGQTVTVNINGTNYTTTVTANAWSIPNLDLSGLADGANFTVTADVSDAAGNTAVQATRPISTIDTTAPTIAISVIAGNDVIDDAEDNSVTVSGTSTGVEDGQTVTVNINGTNYTTTVTANAWSIPNLDLSGLADNTNFTVTADVSDVAGNAAVQATRPISTIDTTAPTISINTIATDDVVDDTEDNSVTVSGTSTGVEDGQTVTVNINGTNYTTTVTANIWSIPNLDLSGLADGANFTVTADVSDAAGNAAVQATRPISTIDTTAPTISIGVVAGNDVIDDAEDNSVTVSGTSTGVEDGQTVTVNINGTNYTTTVTANAWSVPNLDLSGLADNTNFTVTADVSDAAGNAATQATRPISTIDTTAPTISIGTVAGNDVIDDAEDNSVTVSGTSTGVEDGQTVTVNINGTNYTTTVTANAWSIPNLDLSGLADGANFTVTADVSDVAGNGAVQATRPISTIDTTAPTIAISVVAGNDVIDDSEDNSVTINGTTANVEDGQTVTVNINGTNYTTTVTANAWSIPNMDLSGLTDGANFTVTADVSDASGNAAVQVTRPISTIDTTAPTISINTVAGNDVIDDAEDNSVTISGTSTGVEDGQTVTVNINGTNYTTTVTANAWSIPNLDLSGLTDGANFTVTADVSDVAGNAATQATRPISTIDTTAPTIAISVVAGNDVIDDTEDNSVTVSGTSTGVEDGQTVTVNINGTNYTTTVTANVWSIPNLDLSGLADGANFTVTADVSDAAGNAATQATRPISTIDTTAPTIAISVVAGNDIIDDTEDNSVTVSGTSTGVEDGQTVTVNINGTNYTTTVTANAWSIPNLDLSGLADGSNFTVTADVSDVVGNAAVQATRPISTIDTTAPTISIGVVAGNDVIDDPEDNSVTISGTSTGVEDGQTVTVNINGTNYTTTVTANAWSIPNLDLSGLADGANFTVTADVSDVAGNAAVQATRPISTIDTTAPTISINTIATDDVVDDTEDNSVTVNGSTTGVEDGQTVTVNINGTNYSTTVTANAWSIPNLDLSGLADGANFTVTADVSDVAGNAAVQATRPISTIDTTAPTIAISVVAGNDVIDDTEDNSVTVSGTSTGVEDGQTVAVNINGTNYTTTVTANAWSIPNLDLSGLADGANFTVTADVSDVAGNAATQATRPISTIDTTAPTIAISVVAGNDVIDDTEDNSVTVSGTSTGVEDGQTVTVNINGTNYTTTVTANAWSIPNLDLSGLADGANFTVTADVSDVAGNAAVQATRPISTIDTTAPTIAISVVAGNDVIDDAEDNSVTVSGTSTGVEDGQTVTVNINGTNYTTTVTSNVWSIPNLDLSGLADGANFTVTADVSDAAGNAATQATRPISTIDTTAPTIAISVVAGNDVIDDAEDNSVTISGTSTGVEDGQTVTVNINGTNYTTTVTANAWSIPSLDLSGLADGANFTVTADVSDVAGNAAVQATRPISTIDTTAPTIAISVVAGNDVIDDAEDNSVTISGTSTGVEDGQTVTVNINGTDYTTTVTANAWSIANLDLSGLPDGANYTVTADVTDSAGNAATQGTRPISTIDTSIPVINVTANNVTEQSVSAGDVIASFTASDPDGEVLTYLLLNDPSNYFVINGNNVELTSAGVTAINNDTLNLTTLTIQVQASDGLHTVSASDSSSITRVNDNPVANNDSYTIADNTPLSVAATSGLLINDTDSEGDPLQVTSIKVGGVDYVVPGTGSVNVTTTNGVLNVSADGAFNFTPNTGYIGVDTFNYTISDGQGGTSSANFSVEVDATAEAPFDVEASLANGGYAYSVATDKVTGDNYLWRLDMLTGDIVKIGTAMSADNKSYDVEGLTYDPVTGYLYGASTGIRPGLVQLMTDPDDIAANGGSAVVKEFATITGNKNDVADVDSGDMSITLDGSGNMYLTTKEGNESVLYTINQTTGELTRIGGMGDVVLSFDYHADTGKFYGLTTGANATYLNEYTINGSTITNTQLHNIGTNLDIQGMAAGPNYNLWAIDRATGDVYEINVSTGNVSLIVSTAVNQLQGDGFESLAIGPRGNGVMAGMDFTYNLTASFGTNNQSYETHYFLVGLSAAVLADGLKVGTGTGISFIELAAGNSYGVAAGSYVRIEADAAMDSAGTSRVSLAITAPLSPDSFSLPVYAVEQDMRVDLNDATNYGVTIASTNAVFPIDYDTSVSGTFVDADTGSVLRGSTGNDNISGEGGNDYIYGDAGNDVISGGLGNDNLHGGIGNDTLSGNAGNDRLFGGTGDDSLLGGSGIDILRGGAGNDTLTGGTESDTFLFSRGDEGSTATPANDVITDFTMGVGGDVLNLADMLQGESTGNLTEYLHFTSNGTDTVISVDTDGGTTLEPSQQITLTGVDVTVGGTLTDQQILDGLLANGNLVID